MVQPDAGARSAGRFAIRRRQESESRLSAPAWSWWQLIAGMVVSPFLTQGAIRLSGDYWMMSPLVPVFASAVACRCKRFGLAVGVLIGGLGWLAFIGFVLWQVGAGMKGFD